MGTRIHKDIGYFLSSKDCKNLFVENFKKLINNFVEKKSNNFYTKYSCFLKDSKNIRSGFTLRDVEKNKDLLNKSICLLDDEIADGVLVKTISHIKFSRYDDLIDYHEEGNNLKNKIKYLNSPIYPCVGFIYEEGLTTKEEEIFNLGKGSLISGCDIDAIAALRDIKISRKKFLKSGVFSISIDFEIFLLLKALEILKENVSEKQINLCLKPVIITSWI